MTDEQQPSEQPSGVNRRRLLGYAGAGAAIGAVGFAGGIGTARATDGEAGPGIDRYPFHGAHQAGIVTPAQDRLHFAAFDVTATSRAELVMLLKAWTAAAAAMTQGRPVGDGTPLPYDSPPGDTGEALGLPPSRLTLTFGFGPSLFRDADGKDRFGLADRQPKALRRLPHFPADMLDPARSDGDLCVQACADDPQVAVHAIRNLSRIAFGSAALRWAQLGFGRTSSTSTSQATPRNLFGFKDGTANLKAESKDTGRHVWVEDGDDDGAAWLAGGSYLVARRINMAIEPWDRTSLREQEQLIGRDRAQGAPLSGGTEFTKPDFALKGNDDQPLIAMDSHVRLAHPTQNHGVKMLRRGYNFTDGNDALGRLDAGLFFIAYVRDPDTQYIPMQTKLARDDGLMEYLQHRGSALFAVPAGVRPGQYVGHALFA
jgi:deferrochelatase/peroxidase EfeB